MTRDVRIECSRFGLFYQRAQVIDVETGDVLAQSDHVSVEEAIADARLMICDNEREVTPCGAVRTGVKICRPIIFRNRTRLIKTQPRHEVVGAQWDLFR